jgi:hypothetical protein
LAEDSSFSPSVLRFAGGVRLEMFALFHRGFFGHNPSLPGTTIHIPPAIRDPDQDWPGMWRESAFPLVGVKPRVFRPVGCQAGLLFAMGIAT